MVSVHDDILYGIDNSNVIEIVDKNNAVVLYDVDPSDILHVSAVDDDVITLTNGTVLHCTSDKDICIDAKKHKYVAIRAYYGRKTFGGPKGVYTVYDIFDKNTLIGYAQRYKIRNYPSTDGRGRPKVDDKIVSKSVSLKVSEWEQLQRESPDGSPTKEIIRRIRASLHQQH